MAQQAPQRYANIIPMKELDTVEKRLSPFQVMEQLRRATPVRYDPDRDCWDVFHYEDVHSILKNTTVFSSKRAIAEKVESLLTMDPPKHSQMRSLVNKAFTPKKVNDLTPRIIDITNELLEDVKASNQLDIVRDLAGPLPVIVIAEMLGIPSNDRMLFKEWSDVLVKGPEVNTDEAYEAILKEREQTIGKLAAYFQNIIRERGNKQQDDLISLLLQAEVDGQKLREEEVLSFCILLLVAGNETTTNLIANSVRYMTEDIQLQDLLRKHPDKLTDAVEEFLRFYPPIQAIGRVTTQDTVIREQQIQEGAQVINWVISANRDEDKFENPGVFNPDRKPNPHISFGFGIHFCLGAPLARLEGKIALEILLSRYQQIALKEGEALIPIPSPFVFGVKKLPVTVQ
ncbi:cytochrome P450 [Brevibacillus ginsengisoli]|uniref:cytochrome P450 n=1 Tax=Brevibacillus ginsengisoli TaxID=363854 RepID=UPI003CECCB7E